ncbi:UNVERIFIED_CONTAM: hypothetical protein Slati_2122700 [Sesamum latifolium]|uniref:Reverse transcriptase zinc-binding domain-containing protein n=1 Tax=Sesamum latifolium TaxID=2727402 RepID=A0AAW2WV79_9LAMI
MVFFPATSQTVHHIRLILDMYKLASGQEINLQKSSATFSRNTPPEVQKQLADMLGIRLENKHEVYLGLPTLAFRSNVPSLRHLRTAFGGGYMVGRRKLYYKRGRLFWLWYKPSHHAMSCFLFPRGPSRERWSPRIWRKIWQAHVPNKAKVFTWRAIRNILPTTANLRRRMPYEEFCCPFCECDSETPIHTLLRCAFSRQVWALSNLRWRDLETEAVSVEDWFASLALKLPLPDFELVLMVCWTIWWSRNLKLANKPYLIPQQVVDFARSYLMAFVDKGLDRGSARKSQQPHWLPPPVTHVKLNFDGAILDGGRALGLV